MGMFTYVGVSLRDRSGPGLSAAVGPGDPGCVAVSPEDEVAMTYDPSTGEAETGRFPETCHPIWGTVGCATPLTGRSKVLEIHGKVVSCTPDPASATPRTERKQNGWL